MRTLVSFLGRSIETEGGRRLGRCHDLRAELTQTSLRVTGLVIGRRGVLERFGIGAQAGASPSRLPDLDTIPWTDVVRIEARRIVVRHTAVRD
jgi:sporulation protein YlmC with PRC-barrel domain